MNKEGHVIIGLTLILLLYFVGGNFYPIPTDWLQYSFSFLFGNLFPDILDSAHHPFHRTIIGHGHKTGKVILFILIPFSIFLALTKSIIYFHLVSFFIGFLIHLGIDSLSRFGLVK
jgi:hypothetical protein